MAKRVSNTNTGFTAAMNTLNSLAQKAGLVKNNGITAQHGTLEQMLDVINDHAREIEELKARPLA